MYTHRSRGRLSIDTYFWAGLTLTDDDRIGAAQLLAGARVDAEQQHVDRAGGRIDQRHGVGTGVPPLRVRPAVISIDTPSSLLAGSARAAWPSRLRLANGVAVAVGEFVGRA